MSLPAEVRHHVTEGRPHFGGRGSFPAPPESCKRFIWNVPFSEIPAPAERGRWGGQPHTTTSPHCTQSVPSRLHRDCAHEHDPSSTLLDPELVRAEVTATLFNMSPRLGWGLPRGGPRPVLAEKTNKQLKEVAPRGGRAGPRREESHLSRPVPVPCMWTRSGQPLSLVPAPGRASPARL